jgi:hypothetical protein
MPVTLSAAKGLARRTERSFAALRMTAGTPLKSSHGKSYLQMSALERRGPPDREIRPHGAKLLRHDIDQHLLVKLFELFFRGAPHFAQKWLDKLEGNHAILVHGFMGVKSR